MQMKIAIGLIREKNQNQNQKQTKSQTQWPMGVKKLTCEPRSYHMRLQ